MSQDSALFEDDFDLDFEPDDQSEAVTPPPAEPAAGFAPISDVSGGERPLPAISILVFREREDTAAAFEHVARDRRMTKATLEVHEGGLTAAIPYLAHNATPNLLIVESSSPAEQMVGQIDELAEYCEEGVEVIVVGAHNDIALYRQLMDRGVSEYIVAPVQPLSLIRSVSALFANPNEPFVGKSVAVLGAKGGAGASTIAHNLAWSFSEGLKLNTTLVDLDVSFGTTALDFNQDNPQTVIDALLTPERTDAAVIGRLLSKATDRLSLFTAPATVNNVVDIPSESYETVINVVRGMVPYVVLDLPHVWSEWMVNTLNNADEVVLVCRPDLATLRNGKNIIDELKANRPNDRPPRLVINMTGMPAEIPVKDFGAAIGLEPEIELPFDPKLFGMAANNGQMLTETDASSKPAVAIDHLAGVLTGQTIVPETKSLLQKLLGK